MQLADYDYYLPEGLIASEPTFPRDDCRLMVLDRSRGTVKDKVFRNLTSILQKGDVIVLNKSKVIPARLIIKHKTRNLEVLLVREVNESEWLVMVRPGRFFKKGDKIVIKGRIYFTVEEILVNGLRRVHFSIGGRELKDLIKEVGEAPYPPYIKDSKALFEDYQTVFASIEGSVAAPTAGLHFTKRLLAELEAKGVEIQYITLHVGPGTFLPVKTNNIKNHKMHSEQYELDFLTANKLSTAKKEGRRIFAVGTTAVRVLESCIQNDGTFNAGEGETDIFIYPGYKWQCVDGLITNFHLPKSTLLLLTCSFGSKELVFDAYKQAIARRYRFYSFGDAMLIL